MSRRYNARRVRQHLCYTVCEISRLLGVTEATVRRWITVGLCVVEGAWPTLVAGRELARFLRTLSKPKQPLKVGEIYCVACRAPVVPEDSTIYLKPRTRTSVDAVGRCPRSGHMIHRRVRISEGAAKLAGLQIQNSVLKTWE